MENTSEAMFWQAKEIEGEFHYCIPVSIYIIVLLHSYFRRNHAVFSKEIYSFVHRESLHNIFDTKRYFWPWLRIFH